MTHVHRRLIPLTAALLLTAAPALAACSVEDAVQVFGPRPDSDVLSLAQRADTDAAALADTAPELAELRRGHADRLYEEIERLCGVHEDGRVPHSCAVKRTTPDARELPDESSELLRDSRTLNLGRMADVPDESVTLVTGQTIELSALAEPVTLPGAFPLTDDEDQAAAEQLLSWEHAAAHGLGQAAAFLPTDQAGLIKELADARNERILGLQTLLEPDGEVLAAPGYEFEALPAPTDASSAESFLLDLENDTVQLWHSLAAEAQDPLWLEWSVVGAAHARSAAQAQDLVPLIPTPGPEVQ